MRARQTWKKLYVPKGYGHIFVDAPSPDCLPKDCPAITAWTGVAVSRAIKRVTGISSIKWVNDLYMSDKKICGILSELSVESESGHVQHIIVGIGINVNERSDEFPDDLKNIATSIYAETGKKTSGQSLPLHLLRSLTLCRRNGLVPKRNILMNTEGLP